MRRRCSTTARPARRWPICARRCASTCSNEEGQPVWRFLVHRCWVSEYQALPDLDAGANAIAIEHIKLENEGWEQDTTLTEPKEL